MNSNQGGLLVIFYGKPSPKKLGHFMSFSAGVMIYISFVDLLPEAKENVGFIKSNISVRNQSLSIYLLTIIIDDPILVVPWNTVFCCCIKVSS